MSILDGRNAGSAVRKNGQYTVYHIVVPFSANMLSKGYEALKTMTTKLGYSGQLS